LRGFLQKQVGTLSDVKERHDTEVTDYKTFCEFLEPKSLKDKMLGACQRLVVETERLSMPIKKLKTDLDYVREKRDQAKKEVDRVMKRNDELRNQLNMPENKKPVKSVEVRGLREKMEEMHKRMLELERSNIDIGRNPGRAMEQISGPILEDLYELVEATHQPTVEENNLEKSELVRRETEVNGKVYDELMAQVTLKQEIEE